MEVVTAHNNNLKRDPITLVILKREITKEIIVAFSGTQSLLELLDEFTQALPTDYELHPNDNGAKVIGFFYNHYKEDFKDYLRDHVDKLIDENPDYSIVCTGHSLGGALAVHAAADLVLSEFSRNASVSLYTYGQPRVANKQFFDIFIDKLEGFNRIVHFSDAVPHLPPCVPSLSGGCVDSGILPFYPYHHPQEIFYDAEFENFIECSESEGEDPI